MDFNNSQNNAKDRDNVNTRGIQFMNKDGFDPSTLVIGYWNQMLSLKMHPALAKDKQTSSGVYDYTKVVATSLTIEKVTALLDAIVNKVVPAIEEGKEFSTAVPIGADSLLYVGTGVKKFGSVRPFMAIFKSLDEKTKKPEAAMAYEFNRSYTVENYDPEDGSFTVNKGVHSELLAFIKILDASIAGMANSVAHSIRYVDKYYRDRQVTDLNAIAAKLGVTTGNGRGNSYGNRKNVFDNNFDNDASAGSGDASIERLENMSEIDEFLN